MIPRGDKILPVYDVFLSYSRSDCKLANKINTAIRSQNLNVWMDEQLEPGGEFPDGLAEAIINTKIALFLFSDSAVESPWVGRELNFAINNHKYILPVLKNNVVFEEFPPGIRFIIGTVQYAKISEECFPADMERLVNIIRKALTNIESSLLPPMLTIEELGLHFCLIEFEHGVQPCASFLATGLVTPRWWLNPGSTVSDSIDLDEGPMVEISPSDIEDCLRRANNEIKKSGLILDLPSENHIRNLVTRSYWLKTGQIKRQISSPIPHLQEEILNGFISDLWQCFRCGKEYGMVAYQHEKESSCDREPVYAKIPIDYKSVRMGFRPLLRMNELGMNEVGWRNP
jgi:hypothetical protein